MFLPLKALLGHAYAFPPTRNDKRRTGRDLSRRVRHHHASHPCKNDHMASENGGPAGFKITERSIARTQLTSLGQGDAWLFCRSYDSDT